MFKKHMTPLSKGGSLHTHQDKGSSIRPAMDTARGGASNSLQDYAKATPMANPQPPQPPQPPEDVDYGF